MRRGRRGGSYVSNPTSKALVKSLNLFIRGQQIRYIDLVVARQAIEPVAAALSRSVDQLENLRLCCVECERPFDAREVFDLKARKAVGGVHWQIHEAIHAGDAEAARRRMERHLSAYSQALSKAELGTPLN